MSFHTLCQMWGHISIQCTVINTVSITIDEQNFLVTTTECRSLLKFRWINGVDIDPMKELQKLGIGYQCEEREWDEQWKWIKASSIASLSPWLSDLWPQSHEPDNNALEKWSTELAKNENKSLTFSIWWTQFFREIKLKYEFRFWIDFESGPFKGILWKVRLSPRQLSWK